MPFAVPSESSLVFSVSELNARIKGLLEAQFPYVWVRGEISNYRVPASGHAYFTLKDDRSQIRAVLFRGQRTQLTFRPEDGLAVICQGRLTVYEPRGEYQIIVDIMEPEGLGALQLAFEQLKKKLQEEGLFDPKRKRPLPLRPQRIAVITSATGAAIRDILKVLQRSPMPLTVTILPVRVQGAEAAPQIAKALRTVSELRDQFGWEIVIVGRGGGSLEDLWPFNEERVARAIAQCSVPVISAVGHEIDVTISDLVADHRAPTPTAAAQWIVQRLEELERRLTDGVQRMCVAFRARLEGHRTTLSNLESRLLDPRRRLVDWRLMVDERLDRLTRAMDNRFRLWHLNLDHLSERLGRVHPAKRLHDLHAHVQQAARKLMLSTKQDLERHRLRFLGISAQLESLNPLAILNRGYSVTYKLPEGKLVRRADQLHPGDSVRVRLARGSFTATVSETLYRDSAIIGGSKHRGSKKES